MARKPREKRQISKLRVKSGLNSLKELSISIPWLNRVVLGRHCAIRVIYDRVHSNLEMRFHLKISTVPLACRTQELLTPDAWGVRTVERSKKYNSDRRVYNENNQKRRFYYAVNFEYPLRWGFVLFYHFFRYFIFSERNSR